MDGDDLVEVRIEEDLARYERRRFALQWYFEREEYAEPQPYCEPKNAN